MNWSDALHSISILIGIWVAISGINAWRKEHMEKRKIELAEDTLASFYEASDAITYLRHPFSYPSEKEEIEQGPKESKASWEARKNANVVFYRYKQYQELFNKIHALRYRFMAQIGRDEAKPFEDLRQITNEIMNSARHLSRWWATEHFITAEKRAAHQKRVEEQEAIFWANSVEEDPINPRVETVIKEMESICKSVIEGRSSIADYFNKPIFKKS
ncbi:hypothetical protein [Geopsychrobacter electrodiphilus]|uniref:hypothetical protein n=1 Tax=Geopsychrobacter electrodiphilus TaxID=225196 RepID=UPI0003643115|nr:hypothetical protein [Geopsychrobacter electrodiphilus]